MKGDFRYFLRLRGGGRSFFEFVDAVADSYPLVAFHELGRSLGLCKSVVSNYRELLKRWFWVKVRYYAHVLGLGTLVLILERGREPLHLPYDHWLRGVVDLGWGYYVAYMYPLYWKRREGRDYAAELFLQSVSRKYVVKWYGVFPWRFMGWLHYAPFWDPYRGFVGFDDVLVRTLEFAGSRRFSPVWDLRSEPRDHYDLYFVALLEAKGLLNVHEISQEIMKYMPIRKGIPKVRRHLDHLRFDRAIQGFFIYPRFRRRDCWWFAFGSVGNRGELLDVLEYLVYLPFVSSVLVGTDECSVLVFGFDCTYGELRKLLAFLKNLGMETRWFYMVPDSGMILKKYTIPYRNYDIFNRRWCVEKDEVDEWLRRLGFVIYDDEVVR